MLSENERFCGCLCNTQYRYTRAPTPRECDTSPIRAQGFVVYVLTGLSRFNFSGRAAYKLKTKSR